MPNNSASPKTYYPRLNQVNHSVTENFDRTTKNEYLRLTIEAYGGLELAFDHFNHALFRTLFGVSLPNVMLTMPKTRRFMGYFQHHAWGRGASNTTVASEIALNPRFFENPVEVCQTLCDEMSHLAQAEFPKIFGKPGQHGYHNKAFAKTMITIGLMPSSTGKPGGDMTGTRMSDYVISGSAFEMACDQFLNDDDHICWSICGDNRSPGDKGVKSGQDVDSTRERKKRSKTKYTCPLCQLNAWAKPKSQLGCLTCGTRMTAVQP